MNVMKNGWTRQPLAHSESTVTMHCTRVLALQQCAAAITTSFSTCMTMPRLPRLVLFMAQWHVLSLSLHLHHGPQAFDDIRFLASL
jgi:hypothetical protein